MNHIICSHKITDEIEQNLIKLGVTPVKLRGFDKFGKFHPLSCHPDMFCFNLGKSDWIFFDEVYKTNKNIIDSLDINVIVTKNPVSCEYPRDVGLNAAIVGNNLICNVKYTDIKIIDHAYFTGKNIIDVKQGYANCSVCTVGENAVITSDASIYSRAVQNKIDVLLIEKGHINLDGYDYGFIGGCSGLINKNRLVFTGNIELHPHYLDIKNFCEGRGVEVISLSNKKLYDYGSLLEI